MSTPTRTREPDLAEAAAETRQYGRSAGLLTIALGTAGLLAYAFFAVSSHTLNSHSTGRSSCCGR